MEEFKPQQVPDPIISPGQKLPPLASPDFTSQTGQRGAIGEFYSNNKWYFWAILAGLLIIGGLIFFALRPQKAAPLKEANIALEVSAPETAPSGGEVIYKIKVQNNDPAKLVDMDLEMVYDDGVSYVSSTPPAENLSGSQFMVPDLSSGQNAALIVKTVAQGNVNDEKHLTAKLRYKYDNFNSEFVKEATHTVRLTASDVILDMTGPDNATNSEQVNYDVFYRNNSGKDVDNARLQVTYPEGFSFADGTPKTSQGNNTWNLGTLKPQGTGKISFKGTFKSAQPGQSQTFRADFQVVDANGNFFTQGSATFTTAISSKPILVDHKLTISNSNNIAKPGDILSYDVNFQNNSTVVANGVTIIAEIDSNAVDLASIKAETGSIHDGTITWNGSSDSKLEHLNPSEKGTLKFSVTVKNPASKDGGKNLTVVTRVKIKTNEIAAYQPGNEMTVKISSPSTLSGLVSYVTGQLPPKVGQQSTFKVRLELKNASNDYGNGVLTGFIPVGITLDKQSITTKELAAVKYDSVTGKLVWNVGLLAANTGTVNPVRALEFNVSFTPSAAQKGKAVELFKTITFSAKDTFTDQAISLKMQDLASDSMAGQTNNGRVTQ